MKHAAVIVTAALFLLLQGCATSKLGSAKAGGAIYEYAHRGADGSDCSIKITSAREVGKGAVEIGNDCSVVTNVDDLGGVDGVFQVIKSLADKIPSIGPSQGVAE